MSIRGKVLSSSLWSIAGTAATMTSSFVVFALMARLIQPVDFGLVAFAALFIDLTRVLMYGGFPEALIQRKTWDEAAASTAFWMNMLASFGFTGIIAAVATPLAYAYGSPTLAEIFPALSASLIIDAARCVHQAKLRRDFGYKVLAIRTVVASLVSGVAGVLLAYAGFGVWALVANRLIGSVLQTVLTLRAVPWRPRLVFSKSECAALFGFGMNMMGAGLLAQLNGRIAELVIGVVLGPVPLAFFRVGSRALNYLVQIGITPIQTTALSAFSRLKDADAVGSAYVRMTRATALVSFPVFFGAAAIAPDFVVVCFGNQWKASAPIMTALALVVAPATLLYFTPPALAALGRTRLVLISNLGMLVLNAIVAFLTVGFGVVVVAAGQSARAHITAPFALHILRRGVGLPIGRALRSIVEPTIAGAVMAAAVAAARLYLLQDMSTPVRLAICVAIGAAIYAGLLLTLARRYSVETMLELIPHLPAAARRVAEKVLSLIQRPESTPSPQKVLRT
jgi:O-antigen/teichoic acid export membrane protein